MGSIDTIHGLGHRNATKLRKHGIRTTESLLKACHDRKGRRQFAAETGFDESQLLTWVNRAEMMRVKGIGEEYAGLLEAVGVDTVGALRRRNPANLLQRMVDANGKRRRVRRLPTEAMVARWVEEAGNLDPLVAS
jgi:nucleotidyltransferase/DNA polymerase involved in DNA repair